MSDTSQENEVKYQDRLNISSLSIGKIKTLLKDDILDTIEAWNRGYSVEKQCFRIIGPAGVGKTQICFQIAKELTDMMFTEYNQRNPADQKSFEVLMIKAPVLARDDFIIPFPVLDDKENDYSFKMLYSDFVPKTPNSFGLFVIDECSRGDHQLQQLLWQVQNEYSIHRHPFPKGWFVISIDNPDDSEYSMDTLEDAAGLRRQLHVFVEVSAKDFLDYAIAQKFHPYVIEYIQTHPERIYDFQAQKQGSVYANPASWEKFSNILTKMELRRGRIDFNEVEVKGAGLLNTHMTNLFIEFARDKKDINPKDIFYDFKKVAPQITGLLKENNMSKLGELMVSFCTYMTTSMPDFKKDNLQNIINFLILMPIDTSALFISQLDSLERTSEAFKYMMVLHSKLQDTDPRYKTEFYEPIVKVNSPS